MHFPVDDIIGAREYKTEEELDVLTRHKTARLNLLFDRTLETLLGPSWRVLEKFFGFTREIKTHRGLSGTVVLSGTLTTEKDSKDYKAVNRAMSEIRDGIDVKANREFLRACLEEE